MARVHSHDTVLPLLFAQSAMRAADPAAIPSLLDLMKQMSGPALDQLAPLVFDVLELQDEYTAAMVLKRMIAMRPAWIDQQDQSGNSVLMVAAWNNKLQLADILLDAGADTSIRGTAGLNVLDLASTTKGPFRAQTDVGNVLLTKAKFTQQEKDLALIKAAASGCLAMTRCLLAHGARFGADTYGSSALAAACSPNEKFYHCVEIVRELLATDGGQAVIDKGWAASPPTTPAHFAAYAGNIQVLSVLLAAGATVNPPQDLELANPDTPLMAAALGIHPCVIDLLIQKGANASARDENGGNALHCLARAQPDMAAPGDDIRCLDLLARAGTDIFLADDTGQSPLDIAHALGRHALVAAMEAVVSRSHMDAMTPPPIGRRPPTTTRF